MNGNGKHQVQLQITSRQGHHICLYPMGQCDAMFGRQTLALGQQLGEKCNTPITLSRKNYLFCNNYEAAVNMSVIYSLLATCKAHDVNLRNCLNDIITRMPYHKKDTHKELLNQLPHKWKLQHPESILPDKQQNPVTTPSCNM